MGEDLSVNIVREAQDKDIVFVLNPEPLIAAGVDRKKTVGWPTVPMEDPERRWMFINF